MLLKGTLISVLVILLSACGGSTYAPVSERVSPEINQHTPNEYTVRKGDTLYSIAFRYGLDYRALAQQNGIDQRFKIYPGQRLKLKAHTSSAITAESIIRDSSIQAPAPVVVSSTRQTKNTSIVSTSRATTQSKDPLESSQKVAEAKSTPRKPVTAKNSKTVKQTSQPAKKKPKEPVKASSVSVKTASGPIKWQWPASGKVISTFKTRGKVNKGINISGVKGNTVKSAARGRVVYAGSGLLGYGNLVIVDHNQEFLSAYAHNSRVLVEENDMVSAGQKIAEMGSSGSDRVMLHFEIRRDGKPVNPLRYLPKR